MNNKNWKTIKRWKILVQVSDATQFREQKCHNLGLEKMVGNHWKRTDVTRIRHLIGEHEQESVIGTAPSNLKPTLNGWTRQSPRNHSKPILNKISNVGRKE